MVAISNSPSTLGLETTYGPAEYKGLVHNSFLLFLSTFASIGGVLYGYDQGVISGVLGREFPSLPNNSTLQGWMVSVLILGAMFDREDEAISTQSRLRRVHSSDSCIMNEVLGIKVSVLFDKATTAAMFPGITSPVRLSYERYKSLFVSCHLNRRLLTACALQLIQQFTGINAIIYYAPRIFEDIGLSGNSVDLLATGVIGILSFLCTVPAFMFMDRWGRRTVLIVGGIGMGISQLIVATLIGCVNWVIPSEIFPPGVRSQAVGIAIGFIVALITPKMLDTFTFGSFYLYLAFCVFLMFWVYFALPETKGVPIE
ncbi:MFS general substrate transporter [Aspergillus ibericus CBS 121593]|uniref:MFS general substrate transporter n=1 Tax=Aspergillus ibericus CBS 121593 TaxID=1448316 RepID=A0A395H8R0_9EURO|nr:MFS general substrate transporter [Aspergillus ibericus CBS 121593]RAL04026.1 MFS general substrate transporter [Aspergillus ibericus CBS 121593]